MSKAIRKNSAMQLTLRLMILALTGTFLVFGKTEVRDSSVFQSIGLQPASAQIFRRPQESAGQVYERLPDFPKENQYVSKETGKVKPDDTLVSRLIRYHVTLKSRSPNYRFDWKLTLADYLGANEALPESQYPSANSLKTNPMESDRAVIQKLNRSQRDALVDALVSVFNTNRTETSTSEPTPNTSPPAPTPSASPPTTPNSDAKPSLPKPGDAQLLLP